jgi:hypothetical protein
VTTGRQSHQLLAIPPDVRGGLLSYISEAGQSKSDAVFWRFAQREGYGTVEDYVDGSGEPEAVRARMDDAWDRRYRQSAVAQAGSAEAVAKVRAATRPFMVLLVMPDADFAVALEGGLRFVVETSEMSAGGWPQDYIGPVREHVNAMFERAASRIGSMTRLASNSSAIRPCARWS